jgi:hypothetical protein
MNVSNYKVWKLLDIYVDEARFNQDLSNIDTFGFKVNVNVELFVVKANIFNKPRRIYTECLGE